MPNGIEIFLFGNNYDIILFKSAVANGNERYAAK